MIGCLNTDHLEADYLKFLFAALVASLFGIFAFIFSATFTLPQHAPRFHRNCSIRCPAGTYSRKPKSTPKNRPGLFFPVGIWRMTLRVNHQNNRANPTILIVKLLLIEDEPTLAQSIADYLRDDGFLVEYAADYASAAAKIGIYQYDCILIDIMLPGGNGLDLVRTLRKQASPAGILIISAKNALDDRLTALELGSDDYLTKPFHLAELNARVKAILRRRQFGGSTELVFAEIRVQSAERQVFVLEKPIDLTRKEYDLLLFFLANKNRVLTRETIAEHLWGDDADQMDNFDFIYSHIKNLRKKLTDNGAGDYLKAVYGVGYKFSPAK